MRSDEWVDRGRVELTLESERYLVPVCMARGEADQPQEVVLQIEKEVAGYFIRRNLIANRVMQMA